MGRILNMDDVEAAIRGGSVFAAGGGGWADHGRMLGTAAVNAGEPELVSIDEVPDDAFIATAAAIGAPAGTTQWQMLGVDYVKAVEMMQEALGAPVWGLMIGQNGMSSTMNAWLPSALLGTKVVDAVGDMRAHPTGDMGSIGMAASSPRRPSRRQPAGTAPAIPTSNSLSAARPPRSRRSCAKPPTCPADLSPAAVTPCARPMSGRTPRSAGFRAH